MIRRLLSFGSLVFVCQVSDCFSDPSPIPPQLLFQLCFQHPVISLSLKDVGGGDFETAYDSLGMLVSAEATRFAFLKESDRLQDEDKVRFRQLMAGDFEKSAFLHGSLKLLSRLLSEHYGRRVVILIDEYDVTLDKAYQDGYYAQMVKLIRSFLSQALKTNESLEFAVLTGCLRIAMSSCGRHGESRS